MPKGREKSQKKGRKKVAAGVLAGTLVISGIGAGVYAKVNQTGDTPKEIQTAQSVKAQLGSISNTIVGTGNLALEEAEPLTVPSGIKIQEVLVESGDIVTKGETLATVDKASVLSAVEEIQEEIKALDEQISECQKDEEEDCIETSVAGRVKLIYAEADEEVTDVMLENGALLVLSLDGKMALDLTETSGAEEGDTVTVTLSSGTAVTGTVERAAGSSCTITLTDDGALYGDTVTVTGDDGVPAGQGTLYIHQPLEITGTVGTIEAVDVSENESVSAGTQLLTLEGTAGQSRYQELLAEREARSQTLKKLLLLTKNQKITAQTSGTVQSVNVAASASASASADAGDTGSSVSGVSSGSVSSGGKVSQMTYTVGSRTAYYSDASYSVRNTTANDSVSHGMGTTTGFSGVPLVSLSFTDGCSEAVQDNTWEEASETDWAEAISGTSVSDIPAAQTLMITVRGSGQCTAAAFAVEAPEAGQIPVTEAVAVDGSYSGAITWNPADTVFEAAADYQAAVILWAGEGYKFSSDSIQGTDVGTVSGIYVSQDGKTLEFLITYPQTGSLDGQEPEGNSGDKTENNPGDDKDDSTNDGTKSEADDEADFTEPDNTEGDGTGEGSSGSGSSGSGSSGSGSSGSSTDGSNSENENGSGSGTGSSQGQGNTSTSQSGTGQAGSGTQSGSTQAASAASVEDTEKASSEISSSAYSTDVTAFAVSPDDYMVLAVSVDELDINSVETGQKAIVTFDAIEEEAFQGEVYSIGNTASVNGGVAKYTVSLTIPRDDRMREGMNASATITIESKENVITLPMNALQEQGDRVFVYTRQSEDGTLSGEQEVTTGLSDGSTVEITEGLSEGDTVYYKRTGNIQGGSSGQNSGSGAFGGAMGGFGGSDSGSRPERSSGSFGGMSGGNSGQGGGTPPNM